MIAGGLPVLAAWIISLSGLPEAHHPISNVLAEVIAVLLVVLGWRFRRGRLAVAALSVAFANVLFRGPIADAYSEVCLATLTILLTFTLVFLSLLPERPRIPKSAGNAGRGA